jgi:hypothetical protein
MLRKSLPDIKMNLKNSDINRISDSMVKVALIGGVLRGAYQIGKGFTKDVFGAAFSRAKGKGIGHNLFAWGSRIGLGAGTYGGGKSIYNKLSRPPAQPNYTTALRNNILAGNLSPDELNMEDLRSVRGLGMKKMSFLGTASIIGLNAIFGTMSGKDTFKKTKLPPRIPQEPIKVEGGMLT